MSKGKNGWSQYEKLVLSEMKRFNKGLEKVNTKLDNVYKGCPHKKQLHDNELAIKKNSDQITNIRVYMGKVIGLATGVIAILNIIFAKVAKFVPWLNN